MESVYYFSARVRAKVHPRLDRPVFRELWRGFCCQASDAVFEETPEFELVIGDPRREDFEYGSYAITVDKGGVLIRAKDEKGLIYGYTDLLERIKVLNTESGNELFGIGYCRESHAPAVERRMIHYCVFPDTKYYEIRRFLRLCGFLRYTHVVIEFWGMLKLDALKELAWSHAFTKDEIAPLFREANDLGIEIIPMLNHWGHASSSRVSHGKHVVLDQNPRLQPLFSDDGWRWNIESEKVRALLGNVRRELCETAGDGSFFHLGCDEPYIRDLDAAKALEVAWYLNGISKELKENGRRAIVWGDMLISKRAEFDPGNRYITYCPDEEVENAFMTSLDKDIVIADWQYNVKKAPVETALFFKKSGFDVLLCPWDVTSKNDSLTPCAETVKSEGLFGLCHTTWHTLSAGMPDVTRAAELCWKKETRTDPQYSNYRTRTAKLIRKTRGGAADYESSGWAPYEVGNITK